MKRITLFMMAFILSLGYAFSQVGSERPEFSTNDEGPWYFIKVVGTDADRYNRHITAMEDEANSVVRAYNQAINKGDQDLVDAQLWRFELVDEQAGTVRIINKFYDMYLDHGQVYHTNGVLTWMVILRDEPTTDWEIIDGRVDNPDLNLYSLIVTDPEQLHPDSPSTHMGNVNYGWSVVFEGDKYGYGKNSQYYFAKYEEGFIIDEVKIDFGTVPESFDSEHEKNLKEFNVVEFMGITGQYELIYDNTDFQVVLDLNETGALGTVYFYTDNGPGDYSTELTVRNTVASGGTVERKVDLMGRVVADVPVSASPSVENTEDDTWYSIYMDKRTNYYMKDMGADTKPEVYPGIEQNDPSLLWKFVPVDGTKDKYGPNDRFKVISQLGNQLQYRIDERETANGIAYDTLLYSSPTSEHTFSFFLKTADETYALQWNEFDMIYIDREDFLRPAFINKTTSTDYFNRDTIKVHNGNGMIFFENGSEDYVKTIFPKFSNSEVEEDWTWYFMRFNRVAVTYPNEAVVSNGAYNEITQEEVEDESNPFFWWRLVGTWDNLKIVDLDGNEFGPTITNAETYLNAPGEGASYKLIPHATTKQWQLECREDLTTSYRFLNDFGNHKLKVGGYYGEDGGSSILFTPLAQWSWPVGIETPGEADEDPVLNSIYYTIQGVQLANKPTVPGMYIQKNIHASKKVSAQTIYIVK